ncbi:MAG: T9SS type A sorting domain-containing protein [Bacteroidia bacterium]
MTYNFIRTISFLVVTLLLAGSTFSQVPTYQWVNGAYSSSSFSNPVYNDGVAVDAAGNSYVTGNFQVRAIFGKVPDTLSLNESKSGSNDMGDIYVAKYDNTGKIAWVRSLRNRQHNVGLLASGYQLIDADAAGNVYVSGAFYDSLTVGSTTLTTSSLNHYCSFLAKYDAAGNLGWVKKTGTGEIWAQAVSVDAAGNSFVTGYVNGTSTSPTSIGAFSTTLPSQFFIAKYNSAGATVWGKGNSGSYCSGTSLKVKDNTLFVTGQAQQASVFGPDTVKSSVSNSNYVFFVTKMDTSGNYIWARGSSAYDSNSETHGSAVTVDNSGNCYVAGDYAALFKLGSFNFPASSNVTQKKAFLAKYNSAGVVQSVNTFSSTSGQNNMATALCYDHNKVTLAGITPGATNFGSATLAYSGNYIAQFSLSGTNLSVAYISGNLGSASTDYNYGLKTDTAGTIYVSGRYSYSETFGSLTNSNPSYAPATYAGKFGPLAAGIEVFGKERPALHVYPNPAADHVTIDAGAKGTPGLVEISDLTGQLIYTEKTSGSQAYIRCDSWAKGIYFVKFSSGEEQSIQKLIVE